MTLSRLLLELTDITYHYLMFCAILADNFVFCDANWFFVRILCQIFVHFRIFVSYFCNSVEAISEISTHVHALTLFLTDFGVLFAEIVFILTEIRGCWVEFAFDLTEFVFDLLILRTSGFQRHCRNFDFHAFSCNFGNSGQISCQFWVV